MVRLRKRNRLFYFKGNVHKFVCVFQCIKDEKPCSENIIGGQIVHLVEKGLD